MCLYACMHARACICSMSLKLVITMHSSFDEPNDDKASCKYCRLCVRVVPVLFIMIQSVTLLCVRVIPVLFTIIQSVTLLIARSF